VVRRREIGGKKGTYNGVFRMACDTFLSSPELVSVSPRLLNELGRTRKPASRIQVEMPAEMFPHTGNFSSSISPDFDIFSWSLPAVGIVGTPRVIVMVSAFFKPCVVDVTCSGFEYESGGTLDLRYGECGPR